MPEAIFYGVLDLVEERLRERLLGHERPDGSTLDVPVLRTDTIEKLDKNVPLQVSVMSAGFQVDEQTSRKVAVSEQIVCIVAARDPRTQREGSAAMEMAGPLLKAVFDALFAWSPHDGYEKFTLIDTSGQQHEAGFGLFPIAFQTRYVLGA